MYGGYPQYQGVAPDRSCEVWIDDRWEVGYILPVFLAVPGKLRCSAIAKVQKSRFATRPSTRRSLLPLAPSRIVLRLYHGLMAFAERTANCLTKWKRQHAAWWV